MTVRGPATLMLALLVLAGCAPSRAGTSPAGRSLDLALQIHRSAGETASVARAFADGTADAGETAERAGELRGDLADTDELLRSRVTAGTPGREALLEAVERAREAATALLDATDGRSVLGLAILGTRLDDTEANLREAAARLEAEVPEERAADLLRVRAALPEFRDRPLPGADVVS